MTDRTPYCHKIRYGVTGAPEIPVDVYNAPDITLAPTLVEIRYLAPRGEQPAFVDAEVRGYWMRGGERVQPEKETLHQFKNGPDGWPEWLAEEARLHDPDAAPAVSSPLPDQTLRDRIRRVLAQVDGFDFDSLEPHDYQIQAAAIAAVLPPPADRVAVSTALWAAAQHHTVAEWICCDPIDPKHTLCVQGGAALRMLKALLVDDPDAWQPAPLLDEVMAFVAPGGSATEAHRLALSEALGLGTGAPWDAIHDRATELGLPPLAEDPVAQRLGLVPEPADRAAVLLEAAAWFERDGRTVQQMFGHQAATLLRRLAAEAQQQPDTETRPFTPPAHYRRDDGVDCCVHTIPVGPGSCQACRELADDDRPAAGPSAIDEVVAALKAKALALSAEAEEEMRRDLEEQAQVWHEAAELARRTGRKAARSARPAVPVQPAADGSGEEA